MCSTASLQFLGDDSAGYQAGLSLKAFAHGGLWGVGPGAGTIKYRIPDAHSDFIFAVAGEEFGLVLCGLIAMLFCVLTVRLLMRSAQARDPFAQMAGAALAIVTGAAGLHQYGRGDLASAGQGHDACPSFPMAAPRCSPWR